MTDTSAQSTNRKTQTGTVVSDKMTSSAVVEVAVWKTHRIMKKRYQRHERYLVENPGNEYQTGDSVVIAESRPLSRHKRWTIIGRVGQATKVPAKKGRR